MVRGFYAFKADAIHYAAQSGFDVVTNELTNKGAEPDARTDKGVTPLHLAVLEKKEPAIYALLEQQKAGVI